MCKNLFFKKILCLVVLGAFSLSGLAQTTVNFTTCGGPTNWTVPPCVTSISINISGAQGGGANGGLGSAMSGVLTVTPGQVIQIKVGCTPAGVAGGAGGGGTGANASGAGNSSLGGGGA